MTSDTERREAARRLRDKKAECEERGYPWMCDDLILALGYDHDYEAGDEIFDRLADLIDPDCEEGRYSVARTVRPVDREALLALADEMDDLAEAWGGKYPTNRVAAYARSIREALGVVEE